MMKWSALLAALTLLVGQASADDRPSIALTGQVTAGARGAMEGVLVSAKAGDAGITVTVVSDVAGRFNFPAAKLPPGHYELSIRAAGYDLEGPAAAEVSTTATAAVDLALRPTTDLAAQLSNAEWFLSMPGSDEQKKLLLDCMSCHTLERIMRSQHDADEFMQIIPRMAGYANMSTPSHPQQRIAERAFKPERFRKLAEYLATVNLSEAPQWQYPLKTLPRPSGPATKVVITEYPMPRDTIEPHDVRIDADGMLWFSNFGEQSLGRLDPHTGEVTLYPIPVLKPGFPTGTLDLEPDRDGNYWLAMMYQAGIARFDRRTSTFRTWPVPPELNNDAAQQSMFIPWRSDVDGKVWTNAVDREAILRLDLASGKFELFPLPKGVAHSPYGLAADAHNNLYFMDFGDENIGRVDTETGAITLYPTPTQKSRPRRGMLDADGRLWFAEYGANRIGMFDTKAERFQEWEAPTPWTQPYDVVLDREGELWSGSMLSDRVLRLDPKSGRSVEYLLPRETNIRKVFVDNTTTPVTFWAGNNHGAAIVKLEPLDEPSSDGAQ
jgi:virginiamycin B lyase